MRKWVASVLCVPVWAFAQVDFPKEFPAGAAVVEAAELQKKLTGRVAEMTYADRAEVRVEYRDTYAYLNVGQTSDTGKWRVDGSQVCIDWRRFSLVCFEVRAVGDTLYAKRAVNGEIVQMRLK